MTNDLPAFDDLPVIDGLGLRHAWGVFGDADDLGTINLLTPDCVVKASRLVETGEVVNLSLPLTEPEPPLFGREPLRHEIHNIDRNTLDDSVSSLFTQASSQWDGLRHIRAREFGYYGGVTDDFEPGAGRLGIEHWAAHGMVGRGLLLDVAAYFEAQGEPFDPHAARAVSADDLRAVADHQGVAIETGDVLCLRFGWVERYQALNRPAREKYAANVTAAGLAGSEDMARLLWDWHVAAVACDNPAVEVAPGDSAVGSLHRRLLPLLGFAFGEMLDFSVLADRLRERARWTFMFTAVPLNLPGGVGSPANAVAIL